MSLTKGGLTWVTEWVIIIFFSAFIHKNRINISLANLFFALDFIKNAQDRPKSGSSLNSGKTRQFRFKNIFICCLKKTNLNNICIFCISITVMPIMKNRACSKSTNSDLNSLSKLHKKRTNCDDQIIQFQVSYLCF